MNIEDCKHREIVVKAICFTGRNHDEVLEAFPNSFMIDRDNNLLITVKGVISTTINVYPGDYIVKLVDTIVVYPMELFQMCFAPCE